MRRAHSYDSKLNFSASETPISLVMVGAGRSGKFHCKSLSINKQFQLKYIVDVDEDKAATLSNSVPCKFHNDLEWVLQNEDVDAVLICSTTNTHYPLTMKCLKHGKHVFCEKPLGDSCKEISECFQTANSHNLKLCIAFQKRFDAHYTRLYESVKTTEEYPHNIRNIHLITRDYPMPPMSYLKTSKGIVEDMMSHDIDIANLLMNFQTPSSVFAMSHTQHPELLNAHEIEDIEIIFQYPQGQLVKLTGSRTSSHGYDQRAEVCGNFGRYTMDNVYEDTLQVHTTQGSQSGRIAYTFSQRYQDAYLKELDYFYKMIRSNYGPIVEESHIVLTKKLCSSVQESLTQQKPILLQGTLRTYEINTPQYHLYRDMHLNQTLEYVQAKHKEYAELSHTQMSIKDVLRQLNTFIDPSDPDLDEDNAIHAYQTAERIRKLHPTNTELQIVGLIHDLGKIMFTFNEPTWSIVGDTYVVGCEFPKSIVYYETLLQNPDYGTYDPHGIYSHNCGLENLYLSFGHDEYLYQVLHQNKGKHRISQKYMDVIRYHSFYPWHTSGAYRHLMKPSDYDILLDVNVFNQFDLYSKEDSTHISDEVKEYYDTLLDTYFPEILQW